MRTRVVSRVELAHDEHDARRAATRLAATRGLLRFRASLRCNDVVRITASIVETGQTNLGFEFVFEKDRAGRWTEVARGQMTTVHVRQDSTGRLEAEPIPAAVRFAFEAKE